MKVSIDPVHAADRLLEETQAYLSIILALAEDADDPTWSETRQGLTLIARQAKASMDAAREQLDEA